MSTKETTAGKRDGNEAETSGQWSVRPLNPYQAQIIRDGKQVATVGGFAMGTEGQAETMAWHFVLAVNAHDELVNALKSVAAVLTQPVQYTEPAADEDTLRVQVNILRSDCRVALKLAEQAIIKAGGAR